MQFSNPPKGTQLESIKAELQAQGSSGTVPAFKYMLRSAMTLQYASFALSVHVHLPDGTRCSLRKDPDAGRKDPC